MSARTAAKAPDFEYETITVILGHVNPHPIDWTIR